MVATKNSLDKLKNNTSFFAKLKGSKEKKTQIQNLKEQVLNLEYEVDCANELTKLIFLYLQDAVIPFFRQDKLGVYNGALNLYSEKIIMNSRSIEAFYERLMGHNQINNSDMGNTTLLD